MSEAMEYETFIRRAFSLGQPELIGRWGDPAQLANTDVFSAEEIDRVKVGVAYAMEIFGHHIVNEIGGIPEKESQEMGDFTGKVLQSSDIWEIHRLLVDFSEKFEDKYIRQTPGP